MKKVLSIVLAIAMIATMSAVAFAGEDLVEAQVTFTGDEVSIPVTGDFSEDGEVDNWKVNISWQDFEFTFTSGKVWDVENHEWDLATGEDKGTWNNGAKNITVVNHSSEAITATASYAATLEGTTVTFGETNGAEIASAVGTEVAAAPQNIIVATFNGGDATLEIGATDVALGTITLAIA